jgi:uncharacterized protein
MTESASIKKQYGPWAVIAGASEGLGAEYARQLAAAGLNCVLIARRSELLARFAQELEQTYAVQTLALTIDLAEPGATARILDAIQDRQIGLFIYNAGGGAHATKYIDVSPEHWQPLVKRNILTLMESVHAFANRLVSAGRGGIVLVASDAAFGGVPRLGVYAATKSFGLILGEGLWAELKPKGVDVLNVVIGATDTPTLRAVLEQKGMSPDSVSPALPQDVVRETLQHLHQGPTLVFGATADDPDTVKSSSARRARVHQNAAFLSLFFGEDR